MKFEIHYKLNKYLLSFIYSQLIATVISFPILISWGLPISFMTCIGNFLFSPILSLFLILSSLLFITELLGIPNFFIAKLLELNTSFLEYGLSFGRKSWLVYFYMPPAWFIILFIFLLFININKIIESSIKERIKILFYFLSLFILVSWVSMYFSSSWLINSNSRLIILKNEQGEINLIDRGEFSSKRTPVNYVEYELRPFLAKKFGTVTIDRLVIEKVSAKSLEVAYNLCRSCFVNNIIIFSKILNLRKISNFETLKNFTNNQNIKVFIINKSDA